MAGGDDRWTPLGTTITEVIWHSQPDKYQPPRDFDRLDKARRYDNSGYLTGVVSVSGPDSATWTIHAAEWDESIGTLDPVGARVAERRYRLRDGRAETVFDTPEEALASGRNGLLTEELVFATRSGDRFRLRCGPSRV